MSEINLAGEMVKVVLEERGFKLYQVMENSHGEVSPYSFFHVKDGTLVYYIREDDWLVHLGYKVTEAIRKYNNHFKSFEDVLKYLDEVEYGRD